MEGMGEVPPPPAKKFTHPPPPGKIPPSRPPLPPSHPLSPLTVIWKTLKQWKIESSIQVLDQASNIVPTTKLFSPVNIPGRVDYY